MTELTDVLPLETKAPVKDASPQKFGTFLGVYVPCILMLFGVIIFLRLGWIVGQAGLSTTLVVITLSSLLALITMLSMSSIATNIEVKNGGMYYILSRSLGVEIGFALGIPLFFRQALSVAFCVIGFAESLKDLVPAWDITNIGIGTLGVVTLLTYTSVSGALKVQMGIFIAIIASLVALFTGQGIAPMPPETFVPAPLQSLGFWVVFAIFFPAMTGVESTVSLSGDLRNPSKSLPFGTITAILSGFVVYAGIAIFLAYKVPLERLANDPLIMQDLASVPSLIVVGIWGATLSSAIGALLGAPRTLQAMADDGVVPKIFGKTFGAMKEPRIATLVTCAIAFFGVYFGSVNILAPLLTMVSLISYGVLNLSAGIETLMANPSWRPRVRTHWTISILGAFLCLVAMLMISPGYALISLLIVAAFYLIVRRISFLATWVDIREGILMYFARAVLYRFGQNRTATKCWRPHFLVFTKFSQDQSHSLLNFSEAISQSKGFLTMASFVPEGVLTVESQRELENKMANHFSANNIQAFVNVKEVKKVSTGMHNMIEYYGFGPLVPNTVLFGGIYQEDESPEFIGVIKAALAQHFNIIIMNNEKLEITNKSRDIHVWWDETCQDNSELMLVLAYMLQRNSSWKKARIYLKAVVTEEFQRNDTLLKFQKLSIEKRLPIDIEVLVSSSTVLQEKFNLVQVFSKEAEIIMMSLQQPPKEGESMDQYTEYLQTLSRAAKNLPSLVYVLSSEHTPLDLILK